MARGQGGGGAGDPSHDAVTGGTVSIATLAHDLPRRDVVMRSCDCEWWMCSILVRVYCIVARSLVRERATADDDDDDDD